jgi:hypothetical protein
MGFEHSVLSRRVMAVPGWRSTYMEKVAAILDEAFDPHDLVAELDTIFEQIQAAAELDTWKPWRNDEFHYGVALLRQDIPVRVEDVRTQLGCPGSTFTSYGEGCPGTADRVPLHHGSGMAVLGRTFWLRLRNVIPDTAAAMVAGASATSLDLAAVGMPGCTMLVQPTVDVMARTSAQGLLTLPITLPNDPQLLGVQLFSQFAVVDPGASTPLPVIVSNGIETRIGQCR